jgi:formyltetrahydrofolate synthetase
MSVKPAKPVPSDIDIAQAAELLPAVKVAAKLGLAEDDLDLYGKHKAKIHLDVLDRLRDRPLGHYVDVTAITPTPLGEGKTTTTVGLNFRFGSLKSNVVNPRFGSGGRSISINF